MPDGFSVLVVLLGKLRTMIKRLVIAIILIVIVCGGLVGFNLFKSQAINNFFAHMKAPPVVVSDMSVTASTWTPGIDALGTAYASEGVDVPAEVAGVIKAINFKANQRVTKGDVLVVQDDAIEQADLVSAQAAVNRDQLALDRSRTLAGSGVSSQQALDNARASLETSLANQNKAKATIAQKRIEAPFDGILGITRVNVGQYVAAGTAIVTLQNLDQLKIDFTVTERDYSALKIGQTVEVGADANHLDHKGTITGIDPKIDPQSRLASVEARIDNHDGGLNPGQFVRVRIELPAEPNVVAVPQTAVVTSLYGDYVYKVEEQKAEDAKAATAGAGKSGGAAKDAAAKQGPTLVARQVFVTLGRRNGTEVEITKGLQPGDRIVTAGQNKVSNGSVLEINNSIDPSKIGINPSNLEGAS
jgi:membrane fusion protein, multidrug efflux system